MGKFKGIVTELEEMNGPVEEMPEPSDDELAEIENKLDTTSWEDINWD